MRRPVWRRLPAAAPKAKDPDPAPALLARLAAAIASHGPAVFRGRARVSAAHAAHRDLPAVEAARPGVSATMPRRRCWQSDVGDGLDLVCALGRDDARALLEIVLGGPGAQTPTTVEERILGETVDRLLSATERLWEERASPPPAHASWRCAVIVEAHGRRAELTLSAPVMREAVEPAILRVDVHAIPIGFHAELPPLALDVRFLNALRTGSVVRLNASLESAVTLRASGRTVMRGRVGATGAQRAILLDEVSWTAG